MQKSELRACAVAVVWNGTPAEAHHERRVAATLDAVYEDLGLA